MDKFSNDYESVTLSEEEKALKRFESTGEGVEIVGDKEEWEKTKKRVQEKLKKIIESKE